MANVMLLLASILLLFSSMSWSQTPVTIYGDDSYPPYSYTENGKQTGIYTVILERLFQRMSDYKVTLEGRPWKRSLRAIEAGEILALYPPYKLPKDRPYMEYDLPILDEEIIVICRDQVLSQPRTRWPQDYLGLTIGNNLGFNVGGQAFAAQVKEGNIKLQEANDTKLNLLKLIKGRIDCYINDAVSIRWQLNQLQKQGLYQGVGLSQGLTIHTVQGYLGFAVKDDKFPHKADFKRQYLKQLNQMHQSGEINRILLEYLLK